MRFRPSFSRPSWGTSLVWTFGNVFFKKGFQPQMDHRGDHYRRFLAGLKEDSLAVPSLRETTKVFILDVDQTLLKVLAEMLDQVALGNKKMLLMVHC